MKLETELKIGAAGVLAVLFGLGAYEIYNWIAGSGSNGNPLENAAAQIGNAITQAAQGAALDVSLTNPIGRAGIAYAIKSAVSQQNADYSNANVLFVTNSTTPAISQLSQTTPTLLVNTQSNSVGSFNPAIVPTGVNGETAGAGTEAGIAATNSNVAGTLTNPYQYSNGWEGPGFYSVKNNKGQQWVQDYISQQDYNASYLKGL